MTQIRLPHQARMEPAQTQIPNPFSALPSVAKILPNQAQHRNFQNCKLSQLMLNYVPLTQPTIISTPWDNISSSTPLVVQVIQLHHHLGYR